MRALSLLFAVVGAIVAVFATMVLPNLLLLPVAHWLPPLYDPRLILVLVEGAVLALIFAGLRIRPASMSSRRPSAAGVKAAGWFVLTTVVFSLLVSLTVFTGRPAGASTEAEALLAAWRREFPVSGPAGRIAVYALLVPVVEEFLYRGLILGRLMRNAPSWLALAVATAAFAHGHRSWLLSGLLGIGLGLLYLRYRSLWICILAHGAHNLLAVSGVTFVAASLRDAGLSLRSTDWLLALQIAWFTVVLACAAMFLRHVFGRIDGGPSALLRRRVGEVAAPT